MANNNFSEKLKDSVSFQDLDSFRRRYTREIFTVVSIAVASISSAWDFFTGPKLTIFVFALCVIATIFFADSVRKTVKKLYGFLNAQENSTQMILDCVSVVVAIFVPFVIFGALGFLAGLSFQYFSRQPKMSSDEIQSILPKDTFGNQD
jgi:poly(A) polymerase Pap1